MKLKRIEWIVGLFAMLTANSSFATQVVIESNRGDQNSLLSFSMGMDGTLTPQAEIPTNGKGVVDPSLALGPFDSDQEIITNENKTLLFAVNSGSNSVSVFHIQKNGDLQAISGSPFASHGVNPVSLGLHNHILTVVNKHEDPMQMADSSLPNYTTFWVGQDGTLTWTGNSVEVANGSSPSQALVTPKGSLILGADFLGGIIRSFLLGDRGQIQARAAMGLPDEAFMNSNAPRLPLGLAAHPKKNLVYVGLPTANKIGVYKYDRWGQLQFVRTIADSGSVVCWLLSNRQGTRLYASNTADPSVTVYDIGTDPMRPKELQKLPLNSPGGAYQLALTPDQMHLVVLTQRFQKTTAQGQGNELHVMAVAHDGQLMEKVSPMQLQLPMDVRPQGVVIF